MDPSNTGIEPTSDASPALQADSLPLSYQGSPINIYIYIYEHKRQYTVVFQTQALQLDCVGLNPSSISTGKLFNLPSLFL